MEVDFEHLVLPILAGIIGWIFKGYFTKKGGNLADLETKKQIAFLAEQGKNQATKHDIAEITKIIEDVKHEVNLAASNKLSLLKEERDVILNFLDKAAACHFASGDMAIYKHEGRELKMEIDKRELLFKDLLYAQARFDIYITDTKLLNLKQRLKMNLYRHHNNALLKATTNLTFDQKIQEANSIFPPMVEEYQIIYKEFTIAAHLHVYSLFNLTTSNL
jgi:hypothetical protein